METQFHREYLLRLPLPVAQLYSRAYNAKDPRSRHDNCYYLFEAVIKLSACPLIAGYVEGVRQGAPHVKEIDGLLLKMALPSLGQWMAMLRELARHFGSLPDAASHPLGKTWRELNAPRREPSALLDLYRRIQNGPDGKPGQGQSCTLLQVFDAVVQYRNLVIGHGAGRFESFYEHDMGPLLFPAVNEVLAEGAFSLLGPPGARLVYLTDLRATSEDRFEVGLRELTGLQGERMTPLALDRSQAAGLAPNRVAVIWPGRRVPLRLDPLLIFRESEISDEVLLLNRDRSGRQVEYLSYTTGRTERTQENVAELAALLSVVDGSAVTETRFEELAEKSLAETPSTEKPVETPGAARRQIGDYEILAEIGRGGMGVVYLAQQLSLGRLVALKTLPTDLAGDEVALGRFRREMRALARCDHPNIVKLLDSGVFPDGQMYYTMEYVPGCDLDQVWQELSKTSMPAESSQLGNSTFARAVISASGRRRQQAESRFAASGAAVDSALPAAPSALAVPKLPLPPLPSLPEVTEDSGGYVRKVVALIRDAALALQTVHDQGIIHRDISPGNLMLTPDGSRVVLMDFGLAKGQDLPSIARSLTEKGGFVGKLRYAAREQLSSSVLKVGPQADVHGLGVTLWELLTRKRLFSEAQDERQLATMILERDVPRLRQVDAGFDADLEAIVARATEGRATDRLQSAGLMAEYLQLYLDGKPLPIRTPTLQEIAYRWAREHKAVAATAAIVLATIIGALVAVTVEWKRATAAEILQRRAKEMAVQKTREAEAVTEFLQDMLASVDPALAQGREVTVRMVLDQAAQKIGVSDKFRDQPLVEASIRATIGRTFEALGLYAQAEPHLAEALKIRQQALGRDDPDTLKSMNDLALALGEKGNFAESVRLYREALAAEQRVLGKDHPETLNSMRDLAYVLADDLAEYPEAEQLYRQVLEARQRMLGNDNPDTLASMNGLGNVLRPEGKYREAEEMYRKAFEGRRRVLGENHPMTLRTKYNVASALYDQGRYAEAEALHRETLAALQRVLGKDNMYTLRCVNALAKALQKQGKNAEAEQLHREALDIRRNTLGPDHQDTLDSKNNLANLLDDEGKYAEAEKLHREVLEARGRVLGKDHPQTLVAMNNLANGLRAQGKNSEAEELYRQALAGCRRILGEDHPDTLTSMNGLGNVLQAQGKYPEAEELYRQAFAGRRRVLGKDHPDTLAAMKNLADVLSARGNTEEAAQLRHEREEILRGGQKPSAAPGAPQG